MVSRAVGKRRPGRRFLVGVGRRSTVIDDASAKNTEVVAEIGLPQWALAGPPRLNMAHMYLESQRTGRSGVDTARGSNEHCQ